MSGLKLRPLLAGMGLLGVGIWTAVTASGELSEYNRLDAARTASAKAEIYNTSQAITKSGKVSQYDVSFEFLADCEDGSKTSIAAQSAKIQQQLRNQFMAGNIGKPVGKNAAEAPAKLLEAPTGKSYFTGRQTLQKDEYHKISTGLARVKYDPSNPKNCSLRVAKGPDGSKLYVLAPFLTILGAVLTWFGGAGAFNKKSRPQQTISQL